MSFCSTVLHRSDLNNLFCSTVLHPKIDLSSVYDGEHCFHYYYYYYFVVQYCTTTTPLVSSRAKSTVLLIKFSFREAVMKVTSVRIDPSTSQLITALGLSLNQVFQRGLVSLAVEGKIRDPRVIALIKRYQGDLIERLEAEHILMVDIMKHINDNEEKSLHEEGLITETPPICQFCERDLKDGRCTCNNWKSWASQMKVI